MPVTLGRGVQVGQCVSVGVGVLVEAVVGMGVGVMVAVGMTMLTSVTRAGGLARPPARRTNAPRPSRRMSATPSATSMIICFCDKLHLSMAV